MKIENFRQIETERLKELEPLTEFNTVLLVFDSCRFDTAKRAWTPNLDSIGSLRRAHSLSTYTPSSHFAMWAGHIPSTRDEMNIPFYHEPTKQIWRITTAPDRDANKGCGILFEGTDVVGGFRKLDFHVQGIGGVSQFSTGSALRTKFDWSDFIYFGPDLNEELMKPRKSDTFPLNHIDQIAERLVEKPKWFLFINNPESHYPYDWGEGIDEEIQNNALPHLSKVLNLRSTKGEIVESDKHSLMHNHPLVSFAERLHLMQIMGLEEVDKKLGILFRELKSISERPICVIAVGDHGENFGELHEGTSLFGHMHPSKESIEVPLWIGQL